MLSVSLFSKIMMIKSYLIFILFVPKCCQDDLISTCLYILNSTISGTILWNSGCCKLLKCFPSRNRPSDIEKEHVWRFLTRPLFHRCRRYHQLWPEAGVMSNSYTGWADKSWTKLLVTILVAWQLLSDFCLTHPRFCDFDIEEKGCYYCVFQTGSAER